MITIFQRSYWLSAFFLIIYFHTISKLIKSGGFFSIYFGLVFFSYCSSLSIIPFMFWLRFAIGLSKKSVLKKQQRKTNIHSQRNRVFFLLAYIITNEKHNSNNNRLSAIFCAYFRSGFDERKRRARECGRGAKKRENLKTSCQFSSMQNECFHPNEMQFPERKLKIKPVVFKAVN